MSCQVARRIPTQERGKRRVEAILDAAAEVFAEVGFEAATMDQIAERADSSVGSVYQFFDNKLALFGAIAEGCLVQSAALFERVVTPELAAQGWKAMVSTFLDAYLEWERADVRVRALYSNLHLYGTYEDADVAMMEQIIARTSALIALFAPSLDDTRRRLVATTVVNTATSFLFLARRAPDDEARRLLDEVKLLLVRYLEPYVEASA